MKSEFMLEAIREAKKSVAVGDVPVGAVIVKNGEIITAAHNMREAELSAINHAEICAIENACKALKTRRLSGCEMYVTLEPCPMCAGAILMSGIDCVYFGAYEEKFGAVGSRFNLFYDFNICRKVNFRGGIMEKECAALMKDFFEELR